MDRWTVSCSRTCPNPLLIRTRFWSRSTRRPSRAGDVVVRRLPGVLSPLFKLGRKTVLGHEFAGKVEAVGDEVTRFNVGDRVFGSTRGLRQGSHAEYNCVPDTGIRLTVPATIELEEAAAVPIGGLTALYFLRRANIADGKTVLVYGASGSVGTYAVRSRLTTGRR